MIKDFTSDQQARDRPPDSMASATSQRQRGIFDTRCGLLHEGISVMLHNLQPDSQQQYVERIQGQWSITGTDYLGMPAHLDIADCAEDSSKQVHLSFVSSFTA